MGLRTQVLSLGRKIETSGRQNYGFWAAILVVGGIALAILSSGCGSDPNLNKAKVSGTKYWTDKAYPGKAYDVQVTEATKVEGGKYRVKALVDGTQRVGIYDPENESFDEGLYTLSYERGKKIAELEEENRYLKDQNEKLEKEMYQLKLRLKYVHAGRGDPNTVVDPSTDGSDDDDVKPVAKKKAAAPASEETPKATPGA